MVTLRTPREHDWPVILKLANAAVPWDSAGNQEWLNNRQQFTGRRKHYLAEEQESGDVIGYGALEEGPEDNIYRLFVVMAAEHLHNKVGDLVFDRLLEELHQLNARGMWVREYANDDTILSFFKGKGLTERSRFTPPGEQEMVVLIRELKSGI